MQLNQIVQACQQFVNQHDDDLVDRYNHRVTAIFLAIFIAVIATKQYYGEPIVCWTPAQFSGAHNAYANTICWTQGTYPVMGDEPFHQVNRKQVLPYYQWVPFILMFQAVCFLIPNVIWHTFSKSSGVDICSLGQNAASLDHFDVKKRHSTIRHIAHHIHVAIRLKYDYIPTFKTVNLRAQLPFGRRHGNYLYLVYMGVKLLYVINLLGQLLLMNSFFSFHNYNFGLDFFQKFLNGDDYSRLDKAFPRITFCDFKIRNLGDNIHQHSVQCALPINLFNEKFFIMLWFWLIFLTVLTIVNFFSWIKTCSLKYRSESIRKYLQSEGKLNEDKRTQDMFNVFVKDYCYLDGAFIFQIMRRNSNYITTAEIVSSLWGKFCEDYSLKMSMPVKYNGGGKSDHSDSVEINEYDETMEKKPFVPSRNSEVVI